MLRIWLFICALFFALPAMAGEDVVYKDGDVTLEGYLARADTVSAPTVLIVHQWKGLGEYEKGRADMLAAAGYHAFAVDMYGQGIRPKDAKEAGAQASKYKGDPLLSRGRIEAAVHLLKSMSSLQATQFAIIGYCFGGTMALDYARSGADIASAVSFHGGLGTAAPVTEAGAIKASIQVHHGADDPHVPEKEVDDFIMEMNSAEADWHFISYADAVHAFTEKGAGDDPSKGAAYNEKADKRSWAYTLDFLKETLD